MPLKDHLTFLSCGLLFTFFRVSFSCKQVDGIAQGKRNVAIVQASQFDRFLLKLFISFSDNHYQIIDSLRKTA